MEVFSHHRNARIVALGPATCSRVYSIQCIRPGFSSYRMEVAVPGTSVSLLEDATIVHQAAWLYHVLLDERKSFKTQSFSPQLFRKRTDMNLMAGKAKICGRNYNYFLISLLTGKDVHLISCCFPYSNGVDVCLWLVLFKIQKSLGFHRCKDSYYSLLGY